MKKILIVFMLLVGIYPALSQNTNDLFREGIELQVVYPTVGPSTDTLLYIGQITMRDGNIPFDSIAGVITNQDSLRAELIVGAVDGLTDSDTNAVQCGDLGMTIQKTAAGRTPFMWQDISTALGANEAACAGAIGFWLRIQKTGTELAPGAVWTDKVRIRFKGYQ